MAIYISGVKGLPEQVQANKDDIEQLKTQVGGNTQDINDLDGRLTTAEGKITQLETDTQKITYNETSDETTIQGTTKIAIIKNNRIGDDDSVITFGTAQGIELKQGTHTMNYDDDGHLWLDGIQIVPGGGGGGVDYYEHHLTFDAGQGRIYLTLINTISTAMTRAQITTQINSLSSTKTINCSGYYYDGTNYLPIINCYYNSASVLSFSYLNPSTGEQARSGTINISSIYDSLAIIS